MKTMTKFFLLSLLALGLAACGGEATEDPTAPQVSSAVWPDGLFVDEAPADAVDVFDAVKDAKGGDEVVVRGVLGGREKVFVDGRAVALLIDCELTGCESEESCATPWDYCCTTPDVKLENTLSIQVSDPNGKPLAQSLHHSNGMEFLAEVIVAGRSRRVGESLVIDVDKIHVVGG